MPTADLSDTNPAAFLERGRAERKAGRRPEALGVFQAGLEQHPSSAMLAVEVAAELRDLKRYAEAGQVLDALLASQPQSYDGWLGRAILERRQDHPPEALHAFRQALLIRPAQLRLNVDIAALLRQLDRCAEAEELLQKLLHEQPDLIEAWVERGRVARQQARHDAALEYFSRAQVLNPEHDGVAANVAVCLRELARFAEAEQFLTDYLARKPAASEVWMERARLARTEKRHDDAYHHFTRAAESAPKPEGLLFESGVSLRHLGRLDEAAAVQERVLAVDPQRVSAHVELGLISRLRGQHAQALSRFERAWQLQPNNATVPLEVAASLRTLGRIDDAIGVLQGLVERLPDSFDGWFQLGRLARLQAQDERSLAAFQRAQAIKPTHVHAIAEVATGYRQLGRVDDCESWLNSLSTADPATLWQQRGLNAKHRDDTEDCLRCYAEGMKADPKHAGCASALLGEQLRLGHIDEAEATVRQARAALPDHAGLELAEIRILRSKGQLEEAIARLQQILHRDPGRSDAANTLFSCYLSNGMHAAAETLLERMPQTTLAEQIAQVRSSAQLARARYDSDQVHREAARWIELAPASPEPHAIQGQLYLMEGNPRAAAASLDRHHAARLKEAGRTGAKPTKGGIHWQVLREMKVNPFGARAMETALALPLAQRPGAIAAVLDEEPGYAGAHFGLMFSLKRLGVLNQFEPETRSTAATIPRSIIQFWDRDMPADIAETTRSWPRNCAGFEHRVFDDASAEAFIKAHCSDLVQKAFRQVGHATMRADLVRLAVLSVQGGIYADADDFCRVSIEPWLMPGCELLLLQEDIASVGNNFIAAAPGHPFILAALEHVAQNLAKRQDGIWFSSGPGALTQVFCTIYREALRQSRLPQGVRILDTYEIGSRISLHLPRRYKQTEKHWSTDKGQAVRRFRPTASFRLRRRAGQATVQPVNEPDFPAVRKL